MRLFTILTSIFLLFSSCDSGSSKKTEKVPVIPGEYTYTISGGGNRGIWTTVPTRKVQSTDSAPEETGSGVKVFLAKNEYEPFKIIIPEGSGSVSINVSLPSELSDLDLTIQRATFENGWEEPLEVVTGSTSLSSSQPTVLWFTLKSHTGTTAGTFTGSVNLTFGSDAIEIPLEIHVFNFTLPPAASFKTQLNISVGGLVPSGGTVSDAKDILFSRRMTPKSVAWPSGFNWGITWDSDANPNRCEQFYDEPDEGQDYSIHYLARKYMLGEGWNGVGFPTSMIFQFVDNSTPRPGTFCGIDRGDHYGSSEYNAEWGQFLSATQNYLDQNGMLEKAYYYVQNEPQNETDHALAAHLCRITKQYAPNLKIAISEEPKPEIAEDAGGSCGYDIWIAHVRALNTDYALERQELGEELWLYSLDHDPEPYFNPTLIENQGVNQRIIPWVSWTMRARGWAYYDFGRFFNGSNPTVRSELFREGFEDYEYFMAANSGNHGQISTHHAVDDAVFSAASSLTSWTRDADALQKLRNELGLYIEGARSTIPVLEAESNARPRGEYYINFQNPEGEPSASPLTVDGNEWLKVGWQSYSDDDGLGWFGEFIDNSSIALYGFDSASGYNEVQRSYVYDDYGRDNLFEFAIENGLYEVTIGAGRTARAYPGDPHNVTVEGIKIIDDEITTDEVPFIERTQVIEIRDGRLSVVAGGKSNSTGQYSYTFMAYIAIIPVD